jgi:hypothetical protein
MGVGAAAIAGSAVLGSATSLIGGSEASSAAKSSANEQLQMYDTTRSDLSPYNTMGQTAATNALSLATGSPTGGGTDYVSQAAANMPGTLTQSQLEQTPGYQFNLSQGLKAAQSAAASRGLGVSGASLKGAATYATGLADSTYQNQFNNAQSRFSDYLNLNTGQQTNLSNQFSRLNSLTSTGENAAAQTGTAGTYAANNYGNYNTQSGTLSGSSLVNSTNALSQGVNNYMGYQAYQNSQQGGGYQSANAANSVAASNNALYAGNTMG